MTGTSTSFMYARYRSLASDQNADTRTLARILMSDPTILTQICSGHYVYEFVFMDVKKRQPEPFVNIVNNTRKAVMSILMLAKTYRERGFGNGVGLATANFFSILNPLLEKKEKLVDIDEAIAA